jgi:hypothetical protein
MNRPTFTETIAALRCTDPRFPWVQPTDDEENIAAVLEGIQELHTPTADEPDQRGRYGRCTDCRQPWPCPEWIRGEQLAVLWLVRGADRYVAHAVEAMRQGRTA